MWPVSQQNRLKGLRDREGKLRFLREVSRRDGGGGGSGPSLRAGGSRFGLLQGGIFFWSVHTRPRNALPCHDASFDICHNSKALFQPPRLLAFALKCVCASGRDGERHSGTTLVAQSVFTGLVLQPARRRSDAPRCCRCRCCGCRLTFTRFASPEPLWPPCAIWAFRSLI